MKGKISREVIVRTSIAISLLALSIGGSVVVVWFGRMGGQELLEDAFDKAGTFLVGASIAIGLLMSKANKLINPDGYASIESNLAKSRYEKTLDFIGDIGALIAVTGTVILGFSNNLAGWMI